MKFYLFACAVLSFPFRFSQFHHSTLDPFEPSTDVFPSPTATSATCLQPFDAILLFDKSNSIIPEDFLRARTFAVGLIKKFQSLHQDVKIGVIAFGPVETVHPLGSKSVCVETNAREYQLTDMGADDAYRGFYDVQGCGRCFDYCRWVQGPSGGDPSKQRAQGSSYWSCALSANKFEMTPKNRYSSWPYGKCSGEGAESPDPRNPAPVETKVMGIETGTLTPTHLALKEAQAELDANGRPGLPHVIVIITDGVPDSVDAALQAATQAKNAGSLIITVGCNVAGDPNAKKVLTEIASPPTETNFINVDNFRDIDNALPQIQVSLLQSCNVSPPTIPPTVPPTNPPTPLPSVAEITRAPSLPPTVPPTVIIVPTLPPTLPPSLPPTLPPSPQPTPFPSHPPSSPVSYVIKYPCNAPGCAILEPVQQQQPCPVCNHICPSCNAVSPPCASCGCPSCAQQQQSPPCPVCGQCQACQPQPCPTCQQPCSACGGYGMMMQPAATMVPIIPFFADNELSTMLYGQQPY